jgi:TRAP-type uncharacterized transport system fused permease subunit
MEAMVAAGIGLLFCFVLTWQRWGKIFPILTLVVFGYVVFSPYIPIVPEALQAPQVSFPRIWTWIAGDIAMEWGVYGRMLGFMANYLWLLMLFGVFLQAFGATRFIQKAGMLLSSKLASGPAMLAVVTSAMLGSVTGVTASNIAITGSFTIPLMKQRGYTSEEAGAIEMAASNGGQYLPPIMGVTAFIMAEFIGVPYAKVALFALIPALLYFLCVGIYVQLRAVKRGLTPLPPQVSAKETLLDAPLFIAPFVTIVILLAMAYSLVSVAVFSIVATLLVGILFHFARRAARIDWGAAKQTIVKGVTMTCEVSIIAALLGALTAMLEMSGLGYRFGEFGFQP